MKTYEYKFVRLETTFWFARIPKDHQQIIAEHAKNGWRLIQIFSPVNASRSQYFELIFEKEASA